MLRPIPFFSALVATLGSTAALAGESFSFTPRLSVGYSNYSLKADSFRYNQYDVSLQARTRDGRTHSLSYVMPGGTAREAVYGEPIMQTELFTLETNGDVHVPTQAGFTTDLFFDITNQNDQFSLSNPVQSVYGEVAYTLSPTFSPTVADLPLTSQPTVEDSFGAMPSTRQFFYSSLSDQDRQLLGIGDGLTLMDITQVEKVEVLVRSGVVETDVISLNQSPVLSDFRESLGSDNEVEIDTPLITVGGTVALGNYFVDGFYEELYEETSGGAECVMVTGSVQGACATVGEPLIQIEASGVDAERWRYGLTVGYRFDNSLSLFVGYRESSADFQQAFVSSGEGKWNATSRSSFELDGPSIGASYSLDMLGGRLALSASYALQEGGLDTQETFGSPWQPDVQSSMNFAGDADTYGLGAEYSAHFGGEQWEYFVGVDYQLSDFSMDGVATEQVRLPGTPYITAVKRYTDGSIEEVQLSARAGVRYSF